jgi:hypothetical protein
VTNLIYGQIFLLPLLIEENINKLLDQLNNLVRYPVSGGIPDIKKAGLSGWISGLPDIRCIPKRDKI